MKTNEIFEHVLQIVCEECELCYGELINGANKNAVDARCLLICALVSLGFSEENTAAYLSIPDAGQGEFQHAAHGGGDGRHGERYFGTSKPCVP